MARRLGYFLISFLALISTDLKAQNSFIDSLRKELKSDVHDSVRLRILVALSENCEDDSIPNYTVPGLKLSDELLSGGSENKRGIILYRAKLFNNQAYFLQVKGDVSNAIKYNMESMRLLEEIHDETNLCVTLNNIGSLYLDENNFSKALGFYHKSLDFRQRFKDAEMISNALGNIGSVYYRKAQWDSALYYYREAAKMISLQSAPSRFGNLLNNIGTVYSKQKQFDSALVYFSKAKEIWLKYDEHRLALCLSNIADVYFYIGDIKRSIEVGEEAYALARQTKVPYNISTSANLLTRSYQAANDYEKALFYYETFKTFQDSIVNDEAKQALTRAQMQYEYDKKTAIAEVQRKEKESVAAEGRRRLNLVIYSISAGIILLIILSVYIFRAYNENKKDHIEISRQKMVIEEKQKEILDSIRYAKRIQQSFLPTEKYISQKIARQ